MRTVIETLLRGTSPPDDPDDVRIPGLPGDVPPALRKLKPESLTPAAVLIGLEERHDGLHVLLTQRTDHLKHHPGQISFPGGRIEADDDGPVGAALRETEEEIGLAPAQVTIAGFLHNYLTITGYSVTPVVGFITGPVSYRLDAFEVADAFEVPLGFLMDPANHVRRERNVHGVAVPYYEIHYGERNIWGATAGMIIGFYELLKEHI